MTPIRRLGLATACLIGGAGTAEGASGASTPGEDVLLVALVAVLVALCAALAVGLVVVVRRQRRQGAGLGPMKGRMAPAAAPGTPGPASTAAAGPEAGRAAVTDRYVLVAEDNVLVALSLEVLLEDLGYAIVGPAHTVEEAATLAKTAKVDAALLDVDLKGEKIFPVADLLIDRGVPVVFATGFEHDSFRDTRYAGVPVVLKPYDADRLEAALQEAERARPKG